MGKKLFAALIVAVIATFAGYNIYQSQRTEPMSDLMLANVEALAQDESGTVTIPCLKDDARCSYSLKDAAGNSYIGYSDGMKHS